jgi:chromosomal replication initiation ATPase DnaA
MAQLPLDLAHRPALGRDDFLVAPANEEAVAWLDRWPHWPAPALVLTGPAGSGKTHLAQVFAKRTGAAVLAPRSLVVARLPELLGSAPAAIVEDAASAHDAALLHLYNLLAERGGHLLLPAREPPARWGIALADLRSRLLAAPVAELQPPDDTLLAAILVKLFADRQLGVGAEVLAYLVPRLERSFDAAARIVAALDRAALAAHRPVTVPLAREVLAAF